MNKVFSAIEKMIPEYMQIPVNRSIVFILFFKDVPADKHPFYERVYLRTMPINGGESKVIAYLYGGQGTMNVPSWSPDGKSIAFVSNGIF